MTTATYPMARRNQNLYRQPVKVSLGPVSVSFLAIATISVLALLYLTQITKTNVLGQKVGELKVKRDLILADKQTLEVEAARLQSIQRIEASGASAKLVAEQDPVYAQR
jgi:hypothetical protein